uniref:Amine oxidase domain-containing protein n=1 Tax=Alexandrium monilatum TaxID=311494 RepID=A0A7S4SWC3_9DINO
MAQRALLRCEGLVLGAGAAGLAAARELRAAGLGRALVLEARQRVGGRCHTSDELGSGVPLDHGAQWIHGLSDEHPMAQLANELGVKTSRQMDGGGILAHSDGDAPQMTDERRARDAFRRLSPAVQAAMSAGPAGDCSWLDALQRYADPREPVEALFGGEASARQRALLNLRVYFEYENFEGARLDRWSACNGDTIPCLEGPNADVDGGYGTLISRLAEGLDVRFGRKVISVRYPGEGMEEAAEVEVRCVAQDPEGRETEEVYLAPFCVVALPLGVLRSGAVSFAPPLPACKAEAVARLGVTLMDKVELLWETRWWARSVGSLRIASTESSLTFHPWPWFVEPKAARGHPLGYAVLVCFVTGRFAEELAVLEVQEVEGRCLEALRHAFPATDIPKPAAVHATRWGRDPCSLGSWTYLAIGSSLADASALAQSVGRSGCMAFAGEHCCDGSQEGLDMGTVHGAFLSGQLAARGFASRRADCEVPGWPGG